ncbi:HTH-type transcriptional repressor YvoA [Blautia producta]|uniref:HTH-type transcriptional repressor YvoA n=1 Tax=Blautia producta TaxID=33035 RepID=A0A4V0Z772_9FIRM|nr:GntR family transcriptional regulator [Blautia producta]QBE95788.1 HTH-type transcriptional repressor YvoA [Blautia producta]
MHSTEKNEPAYIKMYKKIKAEIQEGIYPADSFLPKESELEVIYGVSRTTVRKAVKLLSQENLVYVRQGCGTRVCEFKAKQDYNKVTSVTESLRRKGYRVTTGNMMIDVIKDSAEMSEALELSPGTEIARVQRLQLADDIPVALMENYIPYPLVPGIETYQDKFVALYQFLETVYGITIDSTKDRIYAVSATFLEAQALDIKPRDALLVVKRICYSSGRPVCADHVKVIGSRYEVEICGQGRSK